VSADPVLVLAWLVLAHLVADFVLQTDQIARAKTDPGSAGAVGLLVHGAIVAALLLPVAAAFGGPGWLVLAVVTVSHLVIDRAKVVLTRRADAAAVADARRRHESAGSAADGLGPAWTPLPAALFALDQLLHVLVLAGAWLAWLSNAPLEPGFVDRVAASIGGWDQALVHEALVRLVVLVSLVIVNVRAGALFVAVLVGPRLAAGRAPLAGAGAPATGGAPAASPATSRRTQGWTVRLGPLVGRVDPDAEPVPASPAVPGHGSTPAPPARVGEAIGILERLLIVTFVLVGAEAAIGLVIAAKTLARFRQLDDRDFAEYYLLGTLASVAIAAISAFVAVAVLDTLG
jgi:hypothetical protein